MFLRAVCWSYHLVQRLYMCTLLLRLSLIFFFLVLELLIIVEFKTRGLLLAAVAMFVVCVSHLIRFI